MVTLSSYIIYDLKPKPPEFCSVLSFAISMSLRAGQDGIFVRQASAISIDGSVTDLPAETPGLQATTTSEPEAVSVTGPVTMLPLESPGLQSGSLSSDVFTLSTPVLGLPSIKAESSATSSSNHGGAIAGGVVAAIIVAVIAAALLLRYRNKNSPRHWRNRIKGGAAGPLYHKSRWQNLESKSNAANDELESGIQSGRSNIVLDDHNSPSTSPVTAKFSTPLITYPPSASRLANDEKLPQLMKY
ncbi:hypothetical protein F5890DRAFT_1224405 [Lentinula detonsa]|uniref:Uncharacterized protein n=1 Tax=Lentinula detonsa TaxID=2804962 RepID=A0AA38Q052_9AGAR|nr:hypothetical protein F5890DRAFT_1224405 [Lentinula detonsa]